MVVLGRILGRVDRIQIVCENVWVTLADRLADCVAEAISRFLERHLQKEEGCFVHGVVHREGRETACLKHANAMPVETVRDGWTSVGGGACV